jgi:hypothetical protein
MFLRYAAIVHYELYEVWRARLKRTKFLVFFETTREFKVSAHYRVKTPEGLCSADISCLFLYRHHLFAPRNFVNPISGRGMDSLVAAVTGLLCLCHRASPTNGDQICRVEEILETARQPGIISCHCASSEQRTW